MKDDTKLYKYIIVGLVCLNLLILTFFILNRPKGPHLENDKSRGAPHHVLDLNSDQEKLLQDLINKHKSKSKALNQTQRALIKKSLLEGMEPSENKKIESKIQELELQKLSALSSHFDEVKSILSKEQELHFDSFKREVVNNVFSDRLKGDRMRRPGLGKGDRERNN